MSKYTIFYLIVLLNSQFTLESADYECAHYNNVLVSIATAYTGSDLMES